MRITLNIDDIRKIDPNGYTEEYINRDHHLPCDTPFQTSPKSKKKNDESGEEMSISPFSNIF